MVFRISFCGYLHSNSILPLALNSATKTKYLLHFLVVPISIRKQLKTPCQLAKPRSRLAIRLLLTAESDRRATSDDRRATRDERREPADWKSRKRTLRKSSQVGQCEAGNWWHNLGESLCCFFITKYISCCVILNIVAAKRWRQIEQFSSLANFFNNSQVHFYKRFLFGYQHC